MLPGTAAPLSNGDYRDVISNIVIHSPNHRS
jgi:hypothetical protein